jgi:serine/threonine-protein kinase
VGVVDEGAAVLSPGDVIGGKYAIEDELGAGAMGVVYRARHLALGRRVALRAARPARV